MNNLEIQKLKELAMARFAAIQANKAKVAGVARALCTSPTLNTSEILATEEKAEQLNGGMSGAISLNLEQQRAVELIATGESCCLIGAAGTGKTTTVHEAVTQLLASNSVPMLSEKTKRLDKGVPGIVAIAFTRRAAANVGRQMPAQVANNAMTLHALLEVEPVEYETGEGKRSMRFEPQRTAKNPLPTDIHTIIIDEASMLSVELFKLLLDALSHEVQFVFVGDIQQLAPVFGEAILGFKLLELPVVELTHVYRQALESPIIRLAHRILSGKQIAAPELSAEWQFPEQLTIARWPANTSPEKAENIAVAYLEKQLALGKYDPTIDMVLIPFNKHFGTIRLGKRLAALVDSHSSPPRKVIEVIAGYNRHYFAQGDRVIYENEEFFITKLLPNVEYTGALKSRPFEFSRFGTILGVTEEEEDIWMQKEVDTLMNDGDPEIEDAASHCLTIRSPFGRELLLKSRGAVNKLTFGYCTTVHKAQGLQAPRVFLLLHKMHDILTCRELLYTGVTRAQHSLTVICDNTTFLGGVIKQQIKGKTLAEKAEYFKGKQELYKEKLA